MIYITGDIHGDVQRFSKENLGKRGISLTRADTVIICGDFGLVWHYPPVQEELAGLDWLSVQPSTFVFVDGNHENFDRLKEFPVEKWQGGRMQPIRHNVFHLLRGEIFTIEEQTFFCFGGATSTDKEWRLAGRSWWPEENATQAEFEYAERNLASHGWQVDYVITHTAPERWKQAWDDSAFWRDRCKTSQMLESIEKRLTYKKWFFGHLHMDMHEDGRKDNWLYEDILRIDR